MNILVINCGSSSLKFLIASIDPEKNEDDREVCLARGIIERIGGVALLTFQGEGKPALHQTTSVADHEAAVRRVIDWVESIASGGMGNISAVGTQISKPRRT